MDGSTDALQIERDGHAAGVKAADEAFDALLEAQMQVGGTIQDAVRRLSKREDGDDPDSV